MHDRARHSGAARAALYRQLTDGPRLSRSRRAVILVVAVTLVTFAASCGAPAPTGGAGGTPTALAATPGGSEPIAASPSGGSPTPQLASAESNPPSTAAPAEATATPLPIPAALAGLPAVTVPARTIRTARGAPSVFWGSRWFEVTSGAAGVSLAYGDMAGAASGAVPVPATPDEQAAIAVGLRRGGVEAVASDGASVAVVAWHRVGPVGEPAAPCSSDLAEPVDWRILIVPMDPASGKPGAFRELARGASKTPFRATGGEGCDAVEPPLVAMSAGRIAYSVESPAAGDALGSTIVLRPITGFETDRFVTLTDRPIALALDGKTIAWLESSGGPRLELRTSTAAHPGPVDLDAMTTPGNEGAAWTVPAIDLGGGRIAWSRFGSGAVFVRPVASGAATQISPIGAGCVLGGFDGSVASLLCGSPSADLNETGLPASDAVPVLWDGATRRLVGLPADTAGPLLLAIAHGWLLVGSGPDGFSSVPLAGIVR